MLYLDNIPTFQQVKNPLYYQVEGTYKTCDIDLVSQP